MSLLSSSPDPAPLGGFSFASGCEGSLPACLCVHFCAEFPGGSERARQYIFIRRAQAKREEQASGQTEFPAQDQVQHGASLRSEREPNGDLTSLLLGVSAGIVLSSEYDESGTRVTHRVVPPSDRPSTRDARGGSPRELQLIEARQPTASD